MRGLALVAGFVLLLAAAAVWLVFSSGSETQPESVASSSPGGTPDAPQPTSESAESTELVVAEAPDREPPTRQRIRRGMQADADAAAAAKLDEIRRMIEERERKRILAVGRNTLSQDGYVQTHHPDGRLFREGNNVDGKRVGLWSETHVSGSRIETEYVDGKKHGREAGWHPDGRTKFLGEYHENQMHGEWTAWHDSGRVRMTRSFEYGELHGPLRTFRDDGTLEEEQSFVSGKEHGISRGWHATGALAWEIAYVDGHRHGTARWYDESSRLTGEGSYTDGLLHGAFTNYDESGAVSSVEQWDRGSPE